MKRLNEDIDEKPGRKKRLLENGQEHKISMFSIDNLTSVLTKANHTTIAGVVTSLLNICEEWNQRQADADEESAEDNPIIALLKYPKNIESLLHWLSFDDDELSKTATDNNALISHTILRILEIMFCRTCDSQRMISYRPLAIRVFRMMFCGDCRRIWQQLQWTKGTDAFSKQTYRTLLAGMSLDAAVIDDMMTRIALPDCSSIASSKKNIELLQLHLQCLEMILEHGNAVSFHKLLQKPNVLRSAIINAATILSDSSALLSLLTLIDDKILSDVPNDFRAKEARKKALLGVFMPVVFGKLTLLLTADDDETTVFLCDFILVAARHIQMHDGSYGSGSVNRNPAITQLLLSLFERCQYSNAIRPLMVTLLSKRDLYPDQIIWLTHSITSSLDGTQLLSDTIAFQQWCSLCKVYSEVYQAIADDSWYVSDATMPWIAAGLVAKPLIQKLILPSLKADDIIILKPVANLLASMANCLVSVLHQYLRFPQLKTILTEVWPPAAVIETTVRSCFNLCRTETDQAAVMDVIRHLIASQLNIGRIIPSYIRPGAVQKLLVAFDDISEIAAQSDDDVQLQLISYIVECANADDLGMLTRPWGSYPSVVNRLLMLMHTSMNDTISELCMDILLELLRKIKFFSHAEAELRAWLDWHISNCDAVTDFVKVMEDIIRIGICNPYLHYERLLDEESGESSKIAFTECLSMQPEDMVVETAPKHLDMALKFRQFTVFVPIFLELYCSDKANGMQNTTVRSALLDRFVTALRSAFDGRIDASAISVLKNLLGKYQLSSTDWSAIVKVMLKKHFTDPNSIELLANLLDGEHVSDNVRLSVVPLVFGHSQFAAVVYEKSFGEPVKLAVLKLLKACCSVTSLAGDDKKISAFESYVPLLLTAYGARMSKCDMLLLDVLQYFETKLKVNFAKFDALIWGKTALQHYASLKLLGQTLWNRPTPEEALACLDKAAIWRSITKLPLRLSALSSDSQLSDAIDGEPYDPRFLLPLFVNLLRNDWQLDLKMFVFDKECLAYTFACLSLHDPVLRGCAYTVLQRVRERLKQKNEMGGPFRERGLIMNLLTAFRRSLQQPFVRLPSVSALFLARIVQILQFPLDPMYAQINSYLLSAPSIDILDVPEFVQLFQGGQKQAFKEQRFWLVDLMLDGFRERSDYQVYERRTIFRLLLSFYDWALEYDMERETRWKILKLLVSVCKYRSSARDLCYQYNLIGWLQQTSLLSKENEDAFLLAEIFSRVFDNVVDNDGAPVYVKGSWFGAAQSFSRHLTAFRPASDGDQSCHEFRKCLMKAQFEYEQLLTIPRQNETD